MIKESTKPEGLNSFTEAEVRAVNRLLGLSNEQGLLDEAKMPRAINIHQWWKTTEPIVFDHSPKQEVFIGWELVSGRLEVVEVNVGPPYEEILQDPHRNQIGATYYGAVTGHPHVLAFHSHPEKPQTLQEAMPSKRKGRPVEAMSRYVENFPRSDHDDVSMFLRNPRIYSMIIVDVTPDNHDTFPVLVAVKTTKTPFFIAENRYRYLPKLKEILEMELLGLDRDLGFRESWLGRKHTAKYNDFLIKDNLWQQSFCLVFYRGFVSRNLEEPQPVRRSLWPSTGKWVRPTPGSKRF